MDKKVRMTFTGGIDSTVLAVDYLKKGYTVKGIYFDYGQKIKFQELKAIKRIASFIQKNYKNFSYEIIDLKRLKKFGKVYRSGTIVGKQSKFPKTTPEDLNDLERERKLAEFLWTPARNLYFLAELMAGAEAEGYNKVAFSIIHYSIKDPILKENLSFPDETSFWCNGAKEISKFSNINGISVEFPFQDKKMTKEDVIKLGVKLKVPLHLTYNCLKGTSPQCGECQHCVRRRLIFKRLNLKDTKYEKKA